MKIERFILSIMAAAALAFGCSEKTSVPSGGNDSEPPAATEKNVFAKGADISWVTQMEKDGIRFYTQDGKETECTALMKEIGFNAIRLRVWVDPEEGWCGKDDVLVKAKRAQALGMRLMIDFHYSDTWADPSKQAIPKAWSSYGIDGLLTAVESHTTEVLRLLKDNDVDVEWVQIGNEINDGMLHPFGRISSPDKVLDFTRLFNAGSNAARKVYPSVKIVLHRSNGHETAGFTWFLDTMKAQKLKYDIIGMSLYPSWWEKGGWNDWRSVVHTCMTNISGFAKKYGKPVIICETGMPVSEPQMSKDAMQYILEQTRQIEECHGVFYWEPQTDGTWKPSSYSALGWNAYDKGAFRNGRPTAALEPFKN